LRPALRWTRLVCLTSFSFAYRTEHTPLERYHMKKLIAASCFLSLLACGKKDVVFYPKPLSKESQNVKAFDMISDSSSKYKTYEVVCLVGGLYPLDKENNYISSKREYLLENIDDQDVVESIISDHFDHAEISKFYAIRACRDIPEYSDNLKEDRSLDSAYQYYNSP